MFIYHNKLKKYFFGGGKKKNKNMFLYLNYSFFKKRLVTWG